jgi:hypothetical protein
MAACDQIGRLLQDRGYSDVTFPLKYFYPMSFGKILAATLMIALLAGGGVLYWMLTTVRWQEAYHTLGVVDPGPHAIALALADGEAPEGVPTGARVHEYGSLLRIRYEELDAAGEPIARHELRALVPALPLLEGAGGFLGELECRDRCRQQLAASNATAIVRGGAGGLAEEWLLRLPVGQSFSLGKTDLKIQDIAEEQLRNYSVRPLRVTMLGACKATLRIGTANHLDFQKYPPLRTTRWLQLEGCADMMNAAPTNEEAGPAPMAPGTADAPSPTPPAPVSLRKSWQDRADWESVRPMQDGSQRWATLMVDEDWLAHRGKQRLFHLLRACQFNEQTRDWFELPKPEGDAEVSLNKVLPRPQRPAFHFPKKSALYFAEWVEIEDGVNGPTHRVTIPSGADSCIEKQLPAAGEHEVVACVPGGAIAETVVVPDPVVFCGSSPLK